jgi:hypothetical protein
MDWAQTLVGAFLGTVLGALASYALWTVQRRKESQERRAQLVEALRAQIASIYRGDIPMSQPGHYLFLDPVPLDGIDPLLELVANDGTEALGATVRLRVARDNYNGLVGVANAARASDTLRESVEHDLWINLADRRDHLVECGDRFVQVMARSSRGRRRDSLKDSDAPSLDDYAFDRPFNPAVWVSENVDEVWERWLDDALASKGPACGKPVGPPGTAASAGCVLPRGHAGRHSGGLELSQ